MKKTICLILTMAIVLSASGCKDKNKVEETTAPETTTVADTTEVTTAATAAETTAETTEVTTEATTEVTTETEPPLPEYTVEPMSKTMYTSGYVNVRTGPSTDYEKVSSFNQGDEITVTGRASTGWYEIEIDGEKRYLSDTLVQETKPVATSSSQPSSYYIEDYNVTPEDKANGVLYYHKGRKIFSPEAIKKFLYTDPVTGKTYYIPGGGMY